MSEGLDPDGKRFVEWAIPGGTGIVFEVKTLIAQKRTAYQELLLFENALWGKVLVLDKAVQLTENDEFFYHESLAHPALLAVEDPESVLIIGGGDGALAEEVLKHPVRSVTVAEIDPEVVEIARAHLSKVHHGAFDDARFRLIIADAGEWISGQKEKQDVILVDVTDPGGPSESIYEGQTIEKFAELLTPRGCLAMQIGPYFYSDPVIEELEKHLRRTFEWSQIYAAPVPTYPTGVWRFFIGAHREPSWSSERTRERLGALPDIRWLDSVFHLLLTR